MVEINQKEFEKRKHIATRKYENFISRLTIDLGMFPLPVKKLITLQGIFTEMAELEWIAASDVDIEKAAQILEEADKRYKARKAKKKKKNDVTVSDTVGNK